MYVLTTFVTFTNAIKYFQSRFFIVWYVELKRKDAEREAQEKRVRELEAMRQREQEEQEQRRMAEGLW